MDYNFSSRSSSLPLLVCLSPKQRPPEIYKKNNSIRLCLSGQPASSQIKRHPNKIQKVHNHRTLRTSQRRVVVESRVPSFAPCSKFNVVVVGVRRRSLLSGVVVVACLFLYYRRRWGE